MDPFYLPGPEFLVFYILFAAVTLAAVWTLRRRNETEESVQAILSDYLEIAYLRGGANEALRVATMNLINRGLIDVRHDDRLHNPDAHAERRVSRHAERGILAKFGAAAEAPSIFSDRELKKAAAEDCEGNLARLGLLPDARAKATRLFLFAVAVFVLGGVAATKIGIALSEGRSNIGFLVALTAVACLLAYKVTHPFRTEAGTAHLQDLAVLFAGLGARAGSLIPGSHTDDFALLVAVFGLGALPPAFSFDRLFPRAAATRSTCGSGCGTSSSSCGSSCGGGGCGGGCGGCGS